ncbi:unnamed protein product [Somion occarium]|uniref:Uncharacterized protein n=1 Tax=Somion occarium TaxID=3059160 RepID=A0ABP1CWH1_9APHY
MIRVTSPVIVEDHGQRFNKKPNSKVPSRDEKSVRFRQSDIFSPMPDQLLVLTFGRGTLSCSHRQMPSFAFSFRIWLSKMPECHTSRLTPPLVSVARRCGLDMVFLTLIPLTNTTLVPVPPASLDAYPWYRCASFVFSIAVLSFTLGIWLGVLWLRWMSENLSAGILDLEGANYPLETDSALRDTDVVWRDGERDSTLAIENRKSGILKN